MTTSQLRVHLAACEARPKNVWTNAPQMPLKKWTDEALKEAYEYLAKTKGATKPIPDTLTCGDEEEL
jgi:hypothetical protein